MLQPGVVRPLVTPLGVLYRPPPHLLQLDVSVSLTTLSDSLGFKLKRGG